MATSIAFGTDGWRGLIARDFTVANVRRVARAVATYLDRTYDRSRPVLVGYDTRFLADEFAKHAATVLASEGWQVLLSDRDCPTPAIALAARDRKTAGALMVTASHNPPAYCGIKYIPDYAGPATQEITDAIVAAIPEVSESEPEHSANIASFDPKPDYLACIYEQIDLACLRAAGLHVVYDALYSTSRGYLDEALGHSGCNVLSLHNWRDVTFGGDMPEPRPKQLQEAIACIRSSGANLGVATDGDSDRYCVIDETGTAIEPNVVMLMLARYLVEQRGLTGAIVKTVATTQLLDRLAAQLGVSIIETAVGFKHIGQQMRETQVLIGGEESGGLSVLGHIPEKDGILANLLVAEAIARQGKPLSVLAREAIAAVGGPLHNRRIDLKLAPEHKTAVMEHFRLQPPSSVARIPVEAVSTKDGVKLSLKDGSWILLRPSGTEPLVRVYAEAADRESLSAILADMQVEIATQEP
ncbi:MAG: phosphoglucomutase/phosphomannomutase family protein [Cyanobacteria bacterium J06639_1]